MWRSRVIAARRIRSAHTNVAKGFSHSTSDFPQLHSMVHNPQALASYSHSASKNFTSIALFSQLDATRFFSSSPTDSITDVEVSTDTNSVVIGDGNENIDSFSIGEMWNDGIDEVNSVLELDVPDSEDRESIEVVDDEVHEVDFEKLDSVLSLLKRRDGDFDVASGSLESSLDDMNLNMSEEFVVRVLETPHVSGENLIAFFKWSFGGKNQEVFSVTTRSLGALVRAVCAELKKKVAYRLWDLLKELGEKENTLVTTEMLNALISLFSRLGKGMTGYEVYNKFGDFLCATNADSYYFTIEALCRRSIFDRVGLVCERMLSEEKIPETGKVGNIICYLCKAGMVKEAHSVYLLAKEKQRYPAWSSVNFLISSLCDRKKNDLDSVHLALKMLEDFSGGGKQKYAIKQFSCVIQGLCRVNDFEGAKALLSKMIEAGPPPGNAVFNTMINALSKSGDMAEAIKIMRMMEARGLKPDVFPYSVIMSEYSKGGEMEEAVKMLVEAKKNHCKLTPVTYHTIIRGYCKLEQFEKAVKLLQEMEEYGVQPNTDEYNKLIQSLCLKAADWGMAEKLMEEMTRKGLHLNRITKSLVRAVKELEEEAKGIKELSCSIFFSLVSRFRAGLKAEIGVFFPMIVLRVLENVAQPNFQQKMIVLRFFERLCVDSQILVDIFINYDCDVNSSNIFERTVNGLLKTAQGVLPGVATTLLPPQDAALKHEAMKCLVAILKSMGDWMNKQLHIPDPHSEKKFESVENNPETGDFPMENGNANENEPDGLDSHSEASSEVSDASTIEQRRAYKLELQEGISLFNRKPKKGIEFLINVNKVGNSPEEIADFLKNASGLNKTLIGDYLGEREDLSLKVMHAYVDSFDFKGMDFDEAIRSFLRGFRLPGEAQKIDRIMEKFAERYCKCNPKAFISADTAYVLAYSVILLNTDAHNPMVKNKMSADDFIRNNRGIDDGKDLPAEYLRSLYARISKNEIKMKEDDLALQQRQSVNSNRILGLDSILNIVVRKRGDESNTSDDLTQHMQEQFKEKAQKSESVYYAATDVFILRFMVEVCWAPMLAAFSVPLDQSDDAIVISQCLEGFRYAIHVTAAMSMKTHRDAFVTSLAKFTCLHSPADIKQKNIEAIKAMVTIAYEDGNYLQEAWEHILTCVSRFEHLHLLGEGAPPDATFFAVNQNESNKSQPNSNILPVLRKKGAGRIQQVAAAMRRGSYDSAGIGGNASAGITSEQANNLVSNLSMLEQVGEMNRIFTRSQKLNSEAIIDFVKALCKVSMEELRSTSDPRVFSLTKIVEIAHYNMNRIRLVWTSIWNVLSDFFVTIGCSKNLSIAIFAMDSLRQLSMKFLEREELSNYNFQNDFMKPFVIVMRKSSAVEIRELIIRCVSQMVLSRVNNVKSGWKSMFMVFTAAASDDHKSIVLLAFEIIEKIVRDYFPYITETETTTFTDCVNCLIAFTNNRSDKDISLSAISFLRFCAAKLAEGDLGSSSIYKDKEATEKISPSPRQEGKSGNYERGKLADKEDHLYFWFPLLAGLSELSFDPRPEIRKSALQVLFDTLRNYGQHFSLPLWERVFDSVLFPIFDYVRHASDPSGESQLQQGADGDVDELDQDSWLYETCTLALQLVMDLFVNFYDTLNPLLEKVLLLLVSFIKRPHQSLAGIGIAAFVRLMSSAGEFFTDDKWLEVVLSLKEAANATLPYFSFILNEDGMNLKYEDISTRQSNGVSAESSMQDDNLENLQKIRLYAAISDAKCHAAVQLLLIQAITEIYNMYRPHLSAKNTMVLYDAVHGVASHAHKINVDATLRSKLQELGPMTQMQDPPLLRLENESYQVCLTFIQNLAVDRPPFYEESKVESCLVSLCQEVLTFYVEIALPAHRNESVQPRWLIPLGSGKKRELAARAPLIVVTLQAICSLGDSSLEKNLGSYFPLLSSLIRCEHGSSDVQVALSEMLSSSVGPVLLRSR